MGPSATIWRTPSSTTQRPFAASSSSGKEGGETNGAGLLQYDELLPSTMAPAKGGFYINSGEVQLKEVPPPTPTSPPRLHNLSCQVSSDEEEEDEDGAGTVAEAETGAARPRRISSSSSEAEGGEAAPGTTGPTTATNSADSNSDSDSPLSEIAARPSPNPVLSPPLPLSPGWLS